MASLTPFTLWLLRLSRIAMSRPERGAKELLDPGQEHLAIHRSVGDQGCGQLIAAQTGYKGRGLPIAERCRSEASPPLGGAPVAPCHVGRCPGFIDKNQLS